MTKTKHTYTIRKTARGKRPGPGASGTSSNKVCQNMPRYDRLSILVTLVLFGLVVSHIVELPTRTVSFVALGVPTTIYLSGRWLIGGLLVVITGAGVDSIVRSHPRARSENWGWQHTLSFWGLPCAVTLLSVIALPLSPDIVYWLAALTLTGLGLVLIVTAQYYAVDRHAPHTSAVDWSLSLAAYVSIFVFSGLTYASRARSLLSATAIAIIGAALAAELLRPHTSEASLKRFWLYAGVVGLMLGEVAWALNHLSLSAAAGGVLFLLIFYAFGGLARQHLRGRLGRPEIVEFAVVSILGLGLLYLM